jgi:hypothetical protein
VIRDLLHYAQLKWDATIATLLATAPWWMKLFDSPTDFILFLIAVAIGLSRLAIMWLQYKNNKTGR